METQSGHQANPGSSILPSGLTQLGPYRLIRELGRGAMGAVFEAEHERLKRRVAIKILPGHLASSPDLYARFQREMEAIGRLEHPHIVLATDAGQFEGISFIAMQFVEGIDLSQVLQNRGRLEIEQACDIIRQVALGLQEINQHQIVHRDIKPSNILLSVNGVAKILDLGIATMCHDPAATLSHNSIVRPGLTLTGSLLGTPDYIAPEQIVSQGSIDIRADIYSLGCTFYHLLSGRPPFSGDRYDSLPTKLLGHVEHMPEPINLQPPVPLELQNIIRKMMAKDRSQRFSNPSEVVDALAPFCHAQSGTLSGFARMLPATRDCTVSHPRSFRKRATWPALGTLCFLMLGFLILGLIGVPSILIPKDMKEVTLEDASPQGNEHKPVEDTAPTDKSSPSEIEIELSDQQEQALPTIDQSSDVVSDANSELINSSEVTAINTGKIVEMLSTMEGQFNDFLDKLEKPPLTPRDWYARAIQQVESGNYDAAGDAYLEYFQHDLNMIDPFLSYASLLSSMKDSSIETTGLESIPGDKKLESRRLVEISLKRIEEQRAMLEQLAKDSPRFGPVYFALAKAIAGEDITRQSLLDQLASKQALNAYLKAYEAGDVLSYYFDPSKVEPTIDETNLLLKLIANVNHDLVENPVEIMESIPFDPENADMTKCFLMIRFAEGVRAPEYRISQDESFQKLQVESQQTIPPRFRHSLPSGFDLSLSSVATLRVPKSSPALNVEFKYLDRNDVTRGPFQVHFDPVQAEIDFALHLLAQKDAHKDWLQIENEDGSLNFVGLLQLKYMAIEEVRYGINVEKPDMLFPVPNEPYGLGTKNQYRLSIEQTVRFVTLQYKTVDGTTSPVFRYDATN